MDKLILRGNGWCGEYPVTAPVEQLRILSQSSGKPVSLRETVSKIYREQGIVNGIYRGFGITLIREIQAYGVWF